ncbi:MAG TPA: thioredoxin family protein [Acetobacteraceae bacterium]|jgi:thiol-disulfide isomerase/thioredoxin|nr:thioredoxin family protein [Acetobacteraceae bacterium]
MLALTRRSAVLSAVAAAMLPGAEAQAQAPHFSNYGRAPEFVGISHWLNSPPLTMAGLRGKVVLIDFWTYSCINCLRTLPYVTRWYNTYKDKGFVVVGVHTPEFAFEHLTANVQRAIKRFGIHYPVAQDNSYATWQAYSNEYWPAEYLINQKGEIVLEHFGEGRYSEMENAIRSLLSLNAAMPADNGMNLSGIGSPEMYFGLARVAMLGSPEPPRPGEADYTAPAHLPLNQFALVGTWNLSDEKATLAKDGGSVQLHFHSAKVYMVASSPTPVTLGISVDGKPQKPVTVQQSQLYTLFNSDDYSDHMLTVTVPKAGFQAFTFTFG